MTKDFQSRNVMPVRILHVDDEPAHLEITRIFLKRAAKYDFEIVAVLSAEKALEKLENEYFDVVVSDYKMPGMNGMDFLETVRENINYADTPFIFFSGTGGPELVEEALKKGAERHITKKGDPSTQCTLLAGAIYELTRESYKEVWERAITTAKN